MPDKRFCRRCEKYLQDNPQIATDGDKVERLLLLERTGPNTWIHSTEPGRMLHHLAVTGTPATETWSSAMGGGRAKQH
jgi:hypothetical protein